MADASVVDEAIDSPCLAPYPGDQIIDFPLLTHVAGPALDGLRKGLGKLPGGAVRAVGSL